MQKLFLLLFTSCIGSCAFAQNNASPYSVVGIGDLEKSSFDRSSGMGHAGVALSSATSLYHANPASYAMLNDYFFHVETSIRYKAITYSGKPITDNTKNFSADLVPKKIAIAIKVKPNWGLSLGLLPFSTANYGFTANKEVLGTGVTIPATYQGSGSVNQAYIANGFRIGKHLSLGLQASYLFGQLQQEETIESGLGNGSLYTKRNFSVGNAYFTGGLQYRQNLNKNWLLSAGATLANKVNMDAEYNLQVKDGSQTLENTTTIQRDYFSIPLMYTTGLAATYKNKLTFALDYNHQDWNSINYKGSGYSLVNSNRFSLGAELSKRKTYVDQQYERSFLQAGVFYSNSYLKMNGEQLKDYGVTIGAGIQSFRGLGLQANLEIGQRGTINKGLIKESYQQFSITLSYREFWFVKGRRYN